MMDTAFLGVENLYQKANYNKLQSTSFLIVGIGGVGSWIAEFLARSGVKNITLVDLDEICVSNINRQIHAHSRNIGKLKISEMKSRLQLINPEINIKLIEDFLTSQTIDSIFAAPYDFVFDAIDSVQNKCLLIQKCKKLKIPFVCIGAAAARKDPTQISVKDLNKTINDKLLFRVKKKLKKEYGYSKNTKRSFRIPTVSSNEVPSEPPAKSCDLPNRKITNCESGLGSVGFVTAAFACAATSYAIKKICQHAD